MARTNTNAGGGGGSGTVTSIAGAKSIVSNPNPITGAGTLEFVNDQASPGNSQYYGTDPSGSKGYFPLPAGKNNIASVDPNGNDDNTQGYAAKSWWYNDLDTKLWICADASTGSAMWDQVLAQLGFSNMGDTIDPGTGNDETQGFSFGSLWFNASSGTLFVCEDATTGSAQWVAVGGGGGSTTSTNPHTPIVANVLDFVDAIHDTYSNIASLKSTNALVEGFYYITDATGADAGLIIRAENTNELATSGIARFVNADFQNIGNYSGVIGQTGIAAGTKQGVWQAVNEAFYVTGDIVIWNGFHFQVIDDTALNGTDPTVNTTAFSPALAKTIIDLGYIIEWDEIGYNFDQDQILWRHDQLNNKYNDPSLTTFQWGNNNVSGNYIETGSGFSCINQLGALVGWTVSEQSGALGGSNSGNLQGIKVTTQSSLDVSTNKGDLNGDTFENKANVTLNLNPGVFWDGCRVSGQILIADSTFSFTNEICEKGKSTFKTDLDAAANWAAGVLTIPTGLDWYGIFNLVTSIGGGGKISNLVNAPINFPFRFTVGNVNTISPIPVLSSTIGDIVSDGGDVILGLTAVDVGDFYELKFNPIAGTFVKENVVATI